MLNLHSFSKLNDFHRHRTVFIGKLLCCKWKKKFFMSWPCKRCTFVNSPPSKPSPSCRICYTPKSPSSPEPPRDAPKWSCKACTFLNHYKSSCCEMCGTRVTFSSVSLYDNLDWDESVGSVFLPLRAVAKKRKEREISPMGVDSEPELAQDAKRSAMDEFPGSSSIGSCTSSSSNPFQFKILTYNVWFREDLELQRRMDAIGSLILQHSPDMICFQEVTPNIYGLFRNSKWWGGYLPSVSQEAASVRSYFCMQLSKHPVKSFSTKPFRNSGMGRELCISEVQIGDKSLVISTTHLESPSPAPPRWDQMFSKERVEQAREAINHLSSYKNAIFCGDMNWDEKLDGAFPLPEKWVDAWLELRPDEIGWTYDTKSNQMLTGNRTLQKRLDRVMCNLQEFNICEIEMVGKDPIPGVSYRKEKKLKNGVKCVELPVLPSDHYGLLLTIKDH